MKKMIKLGIVGATGKLGSLIVHVAKQDLEVQIEFALGRPSSVQTVSFHSCEVVIDVSRPQTTEWLMNNLQNLSSPPALIVGTTGLTVSIKNKLQEYAKIAPVVLDSNFSEGATVLKILSKIASVILQKNWEISILDIHHKNKEDCPSGTALSLQENLGEQKISTYSARFGETPGEHRVHFRRNDGTQKLLLQHQVLERSCFANGAIQAVKWVWKKSPGLYSMQDVLKNTEQISY